MDYNSYSKTNADVFGKTPEKILVDHVNMISKGSPVLDIGAGQGRNTIYLSKLGYEVDAIDPSSVSIKLMNELKEAEKLNFNMFNMDFKNFTSNKNYSAVLVFGLIQILDWDEIDLLKNKISSWLNKNGLLFITSFLVSDDSYERIKNESKEIGRNSYLRPSGEKRTFFKPGEIKKLFQEYKAVYYWEGLGPEHRHGDSSPERHALVGAVFQKLD